MRMLLLFAGVAAQNSFASPTVSLTYFLFDISKESAPLYNSCQRKPSSVIIKTFSVFCLLCARAQAYNKIRTSVDDIFFIIVLLKAVAPAKSREEDLIFH